jgi:hypothetical protein
LLSWCEKILKGKETTLVNDSCTISSVRYTVCVTKEAINFMVIFPVVAVRCWFQ